MGAIVARAPIAYECRVYDILDMGADKWIMGSVQHVHIDAAVYVGYKGERTTALMLEQVPTRPVGRPGRANHVRVREVDTRLRCDGPNG